jgi:hypothetical protein
VKSKERALGLRSPSKARIKEIEPSSCTRCNFSMNVISDSPSHCGSDCGKLNHRGVYEHRKHHQCVLSVPSP